MLKNIFSILLTSVLATKVLSIPIEQILPEKAGDGILCYLPPITTKKQRECLELNGYFHEESIKMKISGYCEEFATCFLPTPPEAIKDINQCVKFKYIPVPETYSFIETVKILDTFYDHFHYQLASYETIPTLTTSTTTTTTLSSIKIPKTTQSSIKISTKTLASSKLPLPTLSTKSFKILPVTTTTTITTTTTKIPPTLSITSTKCIPSIVTIIEKEAVTVTQRETVTVSLNAKSATNSSITVNDSKDETISCGDKWAQCGGKGYNGSTCCKTGLNCHEINEYYSFCQ
ncbi:carbohydrate-binding module family 1 protein [Piromyces sp. E2]|nr:carbohydrate-binding module family 1 protein [Piromyces sp. E2]|eukprot:OUM61497.1 carbohydrate-binding module family 1 protein [Piromyces sp. E2]